jgi:uncharacterized protein YegL
MRFSYYRSLSLFVVIAVVFSSYLFTGCNKTDEIITPGGVTDVNVNGSLSPTSHNTAQGNMFVTDQDGNPLSINSNNVSAVMNWTSDAAGTSNGSVTISSTVSQDIAAAVTMDYSGSMSSTDITCMETGVTAYVNAMSSGDIAEIIKFSTTVAVVQTFTSDKNALLAAVTSGNPSAGSTALYQSIFKATQDVALQNTNYLRTVVAFTDGGENASTVTRSAMIDEALNNAIPVFTVTLLNSGSDPTDMKNIADTTGGFAFTVDPDSCTNISNVYAQINNQFNNAYNIQILWPNNEMPVAGTIVTVTITVTYEGIIKSFTKSFALP